MQKGAIQNAAADNVIASQSIVQALNAYEQQAMDKLNLVNTTMLESTLAQYRKVITNTVNIERQMKAAQEVLNIATGKVITGTESRQQALRQALSQIHKEGITGFYDRIGRKWSPEAYVNMDIRTTVHNTAIEAVKIRQEDYGVDIFRVSRHPAPVRCVIRIRAVIFHGTTKAEPLRTARENATATPLSLLQAMENRPDCLGSTAGITRSP